MRMMIDLSISQSLHEERTCAGKKYVIMRWTSNGWIGRKDITLDGEYGYGYEGWICGIYLQEEIDRKMDGNLLFLDLLHCSI